VIALGRGARSNGVPRAAPSPPPGSSSSARPSRSGGGHPPPESARALRTQGAPPPRRELRPAVFKERVERTSRRGGGSTSRAEGALAAPRAGDAGGRPAARRRLLAPRLYVRFYVAGPPSATAFVSPALSPDASPHPRGVGHAFRAFDLYRPRRIARAVRDGRHRKASTMGALVLVSVMTSLP